MFDLHLHTFYSDGLLSPAQLVKRAKNLGMKYIAITDHDGIGGVCEAMDAGKALGVHVVPGIEFSVELWDASQSGTSAQDGTSVQPVEHIAYMHILGYGIDPDNVPLKIATERILQQRKQRNEQMLAVLRDKGYVLHDDDLKVYPQQTYVGKPNFAKALAKKGYAADVGEAFQSEALLRAPEIRQIHRTKIHAKDAIALIHEAGGKAVLAHPMKVAYREKAKREPEMFLSDLKEIVRHLVGLGLDGMECYYSKHTPEQTEALLRIADSWNLFVSAGTDFHGIEFDPTLEIGKFQMQVDANRLQWIWEE